MELEATVSCAKKEVITKFLISQLSPDSVTKMGDKHRQCHQDGLISTSIFGILNVMHLSKV